MRSLPSLIGGFVLLLGTVPRLPAQGAAQAEARICAASVLGYDTLRIKTDPVYSEPVVAEAGAGGRVLLLGRYNYRYAPAGLRQWAPADGRIVTGLVIGADRGVRLVPNPVRGSRLEGLRAVANGHGWSVVFAELAMRGSRERGDTAAALWYGEYDGARWTHLERIPTPPITVFARLASTLVRTPAGLVWIVRTGGERQGLLVLERRGGAWTSERVFTLTPRAEPILLPDGDLRLAAQQANPALRSDGNSLLLRSRSTGWGVEEVLRAGSVEPVVRLEVRYFGGRSVLTWEASPDDGPSAIRALIWNHWADRRVVTIDSAAGWASPLAPVNVEGIGPVWVTQHGGGGPAANGPGQIHLYLEEAGRLRRRLAIRNPFIAPFQAVARGREILITGAIAPGRQYAASLVVRVGVGCKGVAERSAVRPALPVRPAPRVAHPNHARETSRSG